MRVYHHLPIKISQYLDIGKSGCGVCFEEECKKLWANRVCGPSSLAMVAAYYISKKEVNAVAAVKKLLKDPKIISCVKNNDWIDNDLFGELENGVGGGKLKKLSEFLVDVIISDGLGKNAYIEDVGWHHEGLLNTAREILGLDGRRYDLKDENADSAFDKMAGDLKKVPVITSIYKDLNQSNGGHLVVVYGLENNMVLYADPDSAKPEFIERRSLLDEFKKGWRKRAVVIAPKS